MSTMPRLYEGKVYERPAGTGHLPMTYLYCGAHDFDPITSERLPEREYLFIVWQGDAFIFRSRLTAADIDRRQLVESTKGLSSFQMFGLATGAFRNWEEAEYRRMGVLK